MTKTKKVNLKEIVDELNIHLLEKYNSLEMRNIFIEFGNEDSQDLFILEPPHYNVIDITFRGIEIYTTNHEDLVTREEITDYIKEWFNIYIEALQHLKF